MIYYDVLLQNSLQRIFGLINIVQLKTEIAIDTYTRFNDKYLVLTDEVGWVT